MHGLPWHQTGTGSCRQRGDQLHMALPFHLQHRLPCRHIGLRLLQARHHAAIEGRAELAQTRAAACHGQVGPGHLQLRGGRICRRARGSQGGVGTGTVIEHCLLLAQLQLPFAGLRQCRAHVGIGLLFAQAQRFIVQPCQQLPAGHPVADIHQHCRQTACPFEPQLGALFLAHQRRHLQRVIAPAAEALQLHRARCLAGRRIRPAACGQSQQQRAAHQAAIKHRHHSIPRCMPLSGCRSMRDCRSPRCGVPPAGCLRRCPGSAFR